MGWGELHKVQAPGPRRRTEEELRAELDKAAAEMEKLVDTPYEAGVEAALEWVLGDTEHKPLDP